MVQSLRFLIVCGAITCLLGFGTGKVMAKGCSEYFKILERIADQPLEWQLTPEEFRRIEALAVDSSLPAPQRAKEIFEISLEARLRLLEPAVAKKIRELYRRAKRNVTPATFNGVYQTPSQVITWVPVAYRETILEYYLLAHELEHAIQNFERSKGTLAAQRVFHQITSFAEVRFLGELGSMRAEWKTVSFYPKEMREELAQTVAQDPSLTPFLRNWFLGILNSPGQSLDDYIAAQHAWGRYSKQQVSKMAKEKKLQLGAAAAVGLPAAAFAFYLTLDRSKQSLCLMLPKDSPLRERWCTKAPTFRPLFSW